MIRTIPWFKKCYLIMAWVALSASSCFADWRSPDTSSMSDDVVEVSLHEMMMDDATCKNLGSLGYNFTAFNATEILGTPPDMEGAVGATQYIGMINGWIRSFNKTTGRADNILNISLSQFFAPIARDSNVFDVRIRYDRFTERWFLLCENKLTELEKQQNPNAVNKMFIAVSNGATITPYTKWRFYAFGIGSPGVFADYPTFAIDVNALYVGVALFAEPTPPANAVRAFVLPKAPFILGGTPIMYTFNNFSDMFGNTTHLPPQGVNNFDAVAPQGYFISINTGNFGLVAYKVNNPGTVPTLSAPIPISAGIPPFVDPLSSVPTKQGIAIDGGDLRLLCAHSMNNRLWTTHGVGVNNVGSSASEGDVSRNGCRWYELDLLPPTPTVIQAGTLFMPSMTNSKNERSYIFPSLMSSGQSAMALGCSSAGAQEFINAAVACRAASDAAGTLRAPTLYTNSATPYNADQNRWGDYNYVALDPCDNMTMWAIQQFCQRIDPLDPAQSIWGCQVVQLKAPPPATPISATLVDVSLPSVDTTVTGLSINDSGFYDPGVGFACRLRAQVTGGIIVNSVTYVSPTQLILNISTEGAPLVPSASYDITITNPDGQSVTGVGVLPVVCPFCGG